MNDHQNDERRPARNAAATTYPPPTIPRLPVAHLVLELDAPARLLLVCDNEADELQLRAYLRRRPLGDALERLGLAA